MKIIEEYLWKIFLMLYNLNYYIICEYDIKKDTIIQQIQILNYYEEVIRKYLNGIGKIIKVIENEKQIKENCEIY